MQLSKVVVHGFRKLTEAECTFSEKLTAIVGPNEAGKSTLLEALVSAQNADPIPPSMRPYGIEVADDDIAIAIWYRLDPDDKVAIGSLDTLDEPEYYVVYKAYSGQQTHGMHPSLKLSPESWTKAKSALDRFAKTQAARGLERGEVEDEHLGDELDSVQELMEREPLNVDAEMWQRVEALSQSLQDDDLPATAQAAGRALLDWHSRATADNPDSAAAAASDRREPVFALFTDAERNLESSYDLAAEYASPAPALQNLAVLAALDLAALQRAHEGNDPGAVATILNDAAAILESRLAAAWQQSHIEARLHLDAGTLHILVRTDAPRLERVAEHSQGLKTFIALTAFAHRVATHRPLVLLIDEAEQHLHYDAQADLVRMLEVQSVASKVVYTTHSAGCLPSDLGTGIRAVVPTGGRSRVVNSLWTEGPGYTPLLMALGAGVAAFAPSRYAIIGEGATEMFLLPTLIREAIGQSTRLPYQITAGLSEVGNSALLELELEAPRVAYIVDGDGGGDSHAARLERAGVEPSRILHIGGAKSGLAIEDLLREDVYVAGINDVLTQLGTKKTFSRSAFAANEVRTTSVKTWCQAEGVRVPGKPAVASAVLNRRAERLLTRDGARILQRLHVDALAALQL